MSKAMEDMITDDRKNTALRLLKLGGLTYEQIAEGVGLDIEVSILLQKKAISKTQ